MASIERISKNSYRITVSHGIDENGNYIKHRMKWKPDPGMTPKQIEKELNAQALKFEERIKEGEIVNGSIYFCDFLDKYMDEYVLLYCKPNTIARYERDILRIKACLGHLRLQNIRMSHINSFSATLQADGAKKGGGRLAASSARTVLRTLSSALGKAVRWGYIDKNPCENAEGPKQDVTEARYLDESDARKMLELLMKEPVQWRALFTFDLLSGLRRGELLGLQWQDIDFANHMIYVRRTWNYTPKDGCYFGTPKSARSKRPLHLSASCFAVLQEYQKWQTDQRAKLGDAWKGLPDDDRVFTNQEGAPVFPTSPTAWIKKFTERVGLPSVSLHSLRHTFASILIADDVPIVEVASQMGHAKPSTTENIYGHVIASAHAKALSALSIFDDILIRPEDDESKSG